MPNFARRAIISHTYDDAIPDYAPEEIKMVYPDA
jgi:hypothetical protein